VILPRCFFSGITLLIGQHEGPANPTIGSDPDLPPQSAGSFESRVFLELHLRLVSFSFVSTHTALAMSSKHTYKPTGPFAPQYIQGVYAPSAVLIVGAALVNKTLVPVAVAIAAALAGYQFFNNRECLFWFYTRL
jgi:hypothetical protein